MPPDDRRTIDELLARYENEPELLDLYVEGDADVALFQWFLSEHGFHGVAVYPIDSVNVPADDVLRLHQDVGSRGRVVTLAVILAQSIPHTSVQATCVADRDFDTVLGNSVSCPLLLFTDFACMEMYCYQPKTISKYLSLVARGFSESATSVLARLSVVLQEAFLLRLTNHSLCLRLPWLQFERQCCISPTGIVFDVETFTRSYLSADGLLRRRPEFDAQLARLRSRVPTDPRYAIRGHDFIRLLVWYLVESGKPRRVFTEEFVERSLFGCLEVGDLANMGLFRELLQRLHSGGTAN